MTTLKTGHPGLCRPLSCALLSVGLALNSQWIKAAVIENGQVVTIDTSTPPDSYTLLTGGTLNINDATTQQITSDNSKLNINTGRTAEISGTNGSVFDIKNATITGGPSSSFGISLNNSTATISDSTITSTGVALQALQGQNTPGSIISVSGSTLTGVTNGVSASALSRLVFTGSRIEGTGANSSGLRFFSSDIDASESTFIGGANGITALSNGNQARVGHLNLDRTHVEGKTGSAIRVDGLNLPGTQIDIQVLNGSTLKGGNGNILEVQRGATANMLVGNSALEGNIQVSGNSTANISLDQAKLTGNITAETGSTAALKLDNSSLFTGNLINVGSVTINSQSTWTMAGDNAVGTLAMNQGRVNFGAANEFYQLNVGTLSGNGTFVMDVDYTNNLRDTLNVTGTATGTHSLLIAGSGTDPVSPQALNLVRIGAGDATFSLLNGPVDVGTYSYGLTSKADGAGGTEWFLDPSSAIISPGTSSVLALFNTAPTVWYGELTSLRTRMGELRFNGGQAGGWVRTYGNKYNVAEASGVGYKQNQQGISLGADAPLAIGDGQWLIGALAGYSKSDLDLSRGTTGTVRSSYVGAYTTWVDQDSGYYFDGVLKFNRFDNESKVSMSDGTRSKGDYANVGMGGSLEFGRHIKLNDGYFVEPFTQLSAVVIQGKDYGLDNGMEAEGDRTRSLLGKVGMTAGRNFTLDSGTIVQPYVRAAVAHEFAKNNEVQVNDNVFNNDLSGSRGELGAGLAAALTDRLQLHADFDYSNGEHIEQPFGVNVGARYSW